MHAFRLASAATALTTMNGGGSQKNAIEPNHLAELIKKGVDISTISRLVIIDCRRFLDYNTSHIKNAINVCCSKLIRKRLLENKMSILDILRSNFADSDADATRPGLIESGTTTPSVRSQPLDVVLYSDRCGTAGLRPNRCGARKCEEDVSFLTMLVDKLSANSQFKSVRILKGGFVDFQARYPELCEGATGGLGGMGSPAGGRSSTMGGAAGGLGVASKLTLTSLSQPCLPVSNQGPTKILSFLYLGSQQDAMDQETLTKHGIDYILNMSVSCPKPDHVQEEHFMRIAVNDSHSEKLLPYFERAFEFLDKVKEANSCVLVHCLAGISRSPTLAIAFVMRHLHMSSEEAYRYVKEKRPAISPNFNFLGQLLEYEKQLKAARQTEQIQHGQRLCFNSLTPTVLQATTSSSNCVNVIGSSRTAASTPDYATTTRPLLHLNLQHTNSPAKVSMAQCSSTTDVMVPIEASPMKRSSSCPVKIQKSGIGNGALRDALNLEFEFSPATRTNVNGKRQMVPASCDIPGALPVPSEEAMDERTTIDKSTGHFSSDEAMRLRTVIEHLDKMPNEKFWGLDYFVKRAASPKPTFGINVLRPLHEELPSPSTELSKLNFNSCGGGSSESSDMDIAEQRDSGSLFSPDISKTSVIDRSWWPTTKVQIQSGCSWSSRSSKSTNNFASCFQNLPLKSVGKFERLPSFGTGVYSSAVSYSTCATNPFFNSALSGGGCDMQRSTTQLAVKSNVKSDSDDIIQASEPMTIMEEAQITTTAAIQLPNSTQPEDAMDDGRSIAGEKVGNVSAENPLFHTTSQGGGCKKRRPVRRVSLAEQELSDHGSTCCSQTAPATIPDTKVEGHESGMRSVRSESHLPTSASSNHLAVVREKLSSARSMIISSFSRHMRHLLTKRASWPHALPYFAGLNSSQSEASAMWALAPLEPNARLDAAATSTTEQRASNSTVDQTASSKAKTENTVFIYGKPVPFLLEKDMLASNESGSSNRNSKIDASLLAPSYDIDSPESGFIESPTTLHQRESTSSSVASSHVPPPSASSIFLHRDPERDSLGSTSSLEIAVS